MKHPKRKRGQPPSQPKGADSIRFGTDGWRAEVAETFTLPNVRAVTQGVAEYLAKHPARGRRKAVLVGYDTRPLGDVFAEAVAEVFAGNGFEVLLTRGPSPTPAISFAIRQLRLSGGIAVTASHNPFTYNGLKFKPFYAGPAEESMTRWIEKRLFKRPLRQVALADGLKAKRILRIDLDSKYMKFLRGYVRWSRIRGARFRLAYDPMHGAGRDLLERLLEGSRVQIFPVRPPGERPSGRHRPEPIAQHLQELSAHVRKHRCHLGLANDGDADRAGLVGPDGRFISSQETMSLLLWHLLENRGQRGRVVTTVAGTNLVDAICEAFEVPLTRTPVGFKHIARIMRTEKVLFGGEESGGFGFPGCVPERDGLLAGLLVLEMMALRGKTLAELLRQMRKRFGHWAYARADLELDRPLPTARLIQWAKSVGRETLQLGAGAPVCRIDTQDGAKIVLADRSWLLLRPSGTEPLLRLYAEGTGRGQVEKLLAAGRRIGRSVQKVPDPF